ncbi:MAG: single-stranded-DNA-specific exonuclease RecJ [Armatimonadota bacterium]
MAIFHTEPKRPSSPRQSLTGTRWQIIPPADRLPAEFPPAIAQVLATRNVIEPAEVETFFNAGLCALPDPLLLPDMAAAVEAVQDALARGARIRIFGDYDTDGITSTALLVRAFSALGGTVDWYLPHRIDDGYGLNTDALDNAKAEGVELGITVDNGITAHTQLAYAQQIGLRMIVTDHHEPDGQLPPAVAVLNPKRADSAYPFRELAGVGVAFMLLCAVCTARNLSPDAPSRFLDLVTIGTIADVAPLTGENRILVRHGLPMLTPLNKKLGIGALLRAVGVTECAGCYDVGFQIGPRLNAAGRLAHASIALNLLLTADRLEAEKLAGQLCEQNTQRQEEEMRTLRQALAMVDDRDLSREKVLVLSSTEWHPGVIGIVASRLMERYHRPAALIAVQDGVGKGSARARAPFHLWEALDECKHLLHRFGGHRVAAGFELDEANIPTLRDALCGVADRTMTEEDLLPTLHVDAWVELSEITTAFGRQMEALSPFGMGNPTPVFAAADVVVQQCIRRGQDGSHLAISFSPVPGSRAISGMWFRHGDMVEKLHTGDRVDVAFTVDLNCWQGITTARLMVKDIMV